MAVETPVRLRVRTALFTFWNSLFEGRRLQTYINSTHLEAETNPIVCPLKPIMCLPRLLLGINFLTGLRRMISGFQITASIQPPTVAQHSTELRLPDDYTQQRALSLPSHPPITEDTFRSIYARLDLLEQEVFKPKALIDEVDSKKSSTLDDRSSNIDVSNVSTASELSSECWSSVFDVIIKRLDNCAGQPSVNECIMSMRNLKKDLSRISECLQAAQMDVKAHKACEGFLKLQPDAKHEGNQDEPAPTTSKKEVGWWRSSAPRGVLKAVGRQSTASSKHWGPCFYCPCTEWKPGHSCEGSRLAQLRKKERESSGS